MLKTLKKAAAAFGLAAAATAGGFATAEDAHATTITWEGTLEATGGPMVENGTIAVGTVIPFSLELQSDAADQNSNPQVGSYALDAVTLGLPAAVGGPVTFAGPGIMDLVISDDCLSGERDCIAATVTPAGGPTRFVLSMNTFDTSLFASAALPETLPPFSVWDGNRDFSVTFVTLSGSTSAWGQVTALHAVPEPGTGALLGLGLGALAAVRRRTASRSGPTPS